MNIQQKPASKQSLEVANVTGRAAHDDEPHSATFRLPALNTRLTKLEANGYGPHLLMLIPPGEPYLRWRKATQRYEPAVANGKSPGIWDGNEWRDRRGWTKSETAPSEIECWREWPEQTGIGLRTGNIGVFDVDVKVDPQSADPHAVKARALIDEIRGVLAKKLRLPADKLPMRRRSNSTSVAFFARIETLLKKADMAVSSDGHRHAIEFLADGQQVVISGQHESGGTQSSNLMTWNLNDLPLINEADVTELMDEFRNRARELGYAVDEKPGRLSPWTSVQTRDPIFRAVLERKDEWLPDVLGAPAAAALPVRITSGDLDRELEEDLEVFPDGIYDFGTRRSHDPITLICEFGAIDIQGEIIFGGAPEYIPGDGEVFEIAESVFDTVRRPSPPEAITWLCRRLGDTDQVSYIGTHDWKSASMHVAKVLGFDIDSLKVAPLFDFLDWQAFGKASPDEWGPADIEASAKLIAALRITDPGKHRELVQVWANRSVEPLPADVTEATIQQAQIAEAERHKQEQGELLAGISVVSSAINARSIPIREYVIEPRLLVGDVTQVVGEPAVSKSSLALLDAIRIAAGRPDIRVGDEQLHRGGPVIVYNAEDRLDEMRRRLTALQINYGVRDTPHPIILWSGVDGPTLKVLKRGSGKNGSLERAPGADFLEDMIRHHQPVLVCLDPQVSLLAGALENSNDDINDLYQEIANIAAKHSTSIQIIHHTSKATRDNAGDMGAGRGGFAAAGKARVVYTITNVTGKAEDEKQWGISPADNLIRLDSAKMNHAARSRTPTFLRRRSVPVGNGQGIPLTTAAALYEHSPRQVLEATGDFAPVLEAVNLDELRRLAKAPNVDTEISQKIAETVYLAMGEADECKASSIIPVVGERLRAEGVTSATSRQELTPIITNALLGTGVTLERSGQKVRVVAVKLGGSNNAPWVFRRTYETKNELEGVEGVVEGFND